MNKRRNTVRKLFTGSPRMSRSFGTAGSRYPETQGFSIETMSMIGGSELQGTSSIKKENTYKMEPDHPFRTKVVDDVVSDVMNDYLNSVTYDYQEVKLLSQQLSNRVLESVKKLGFSRYKFVVSISIGSLKEQPSVEFGSRCLWNKSTDSYTTVRYENKSLFAIAMIYGIYFA